MRVMSCVIAIQESLALNEGHVTTTGPGNVSLSNPERGCVTQPKVAVLGYLGNKARHSSQSQRGCVLIVSHDDRLRSCADRVCHLEDGRLRESDGDPRPGDATTRPANGEDGGGKGRDRRNVS